MIGSWSMMPADEASNDIRYRLRSVGSADRCRFPVLRFLGNDRACMVRSCPLSSSLVLLSVPANWTGISHGVCRLASSSKHTVVLGAAMCLKHTCRPQFARLSSGVVHNASRAQVRGGNGEEASIERALTND